MLCVTCSESIDINGLWYSQIVVGNSWLDYCKKCKPKNKTLKHNDIEIFDCCKTQVTSSRLRQCVAPGDGTQLRRYCKDCVSGNPPAIPDVYLSPTAHGIQYEENIADPKTGKPIPFYDKASKKAAMDIAGVREAGDKVHGARNEENLRKKTYFS